MRDMRKIAVIIPALNESLTIAKVVEGAREQGCDVYVVNDASTDDTRDRALEAGAEVLTVPFTAGAWCAVQAGILHAMKKEKYDGFLTMDGDGQHDPASIQAMVDEMGASGANVVIGSFTERGSAARHVAWRLFSLLTRLKISDLTSGLRLYDAKAASALLSRSAALYDYQDLGVLLQLRRHGLDFHEVQVRMHQRCNGCSRVFRSWPAVACYMLKTCVLILADWVAGAGQSTCDWREYDVV